MDIKSLREKAEMLSQNPSMNSVFGIVNDICRFLEGKFPPPKKSCQGERAQKEKEKIMFKCKICLEKDKIIEFLKTQNKDLYDRLMAFNKDAFTYYKAETKQGESLYPWAVDKDGKRFNYKDTNPEEAKSDVLRAMGEEPITVEDKQGA